MPVIINSEKGFALITSILLLLALTVIGVAATNTSSIETYISGNEKVYKQNFYQAEGASSEAADMNLSDDTWVYQPNLGDVLPQIPDVGGIDVDVLCSETSTLNDGVTDVRYGVVDYDIPQGVKGTGHSIKVEGATAGGRMNFFDLYGQSQNNNSTVIIRKGYTKRL